MSCLVDHDIYKSSVTCMDDGFRDDKQLAVSFLH